MDRKKGDGKAAIMVGAVFMLVSVLLSFILPAQGILPTVPPVLAICGAGFFIGGAILDSKR